MELGMHPMGKAREKQTVCLVVLTQVGKRVEVDVTMEMHSWPARDQMRCD